jgi:hypothetical protein
MKRPSDNNNNRPYGDDDDDDDDVVFFKIVKKTSTPSSPVAVVAPIPAKISRTVQATRKPVVAVKREREQEEEAAVFIAPASKHVGVPEYSGEDVSSPVLGVLGTFDKGHKGRQAEQQRVDLSRQRIRQSHKTIEPLPANGKAVVIDDSLLTDSVQNMARQYEAQIQLQTTTKPTKKQKSDPPPHPVRASEQQEEEEDDEGAAAAVFTDNVFDDGGDGNQTRAEEFHAIAKALVLPNMRAPETGSKFVVNTFPEYLDRSEPRRMNFERALSTLKVQNQSSAVKVRNPEVRYKDAKGVLDKRLGLFQFRKYAVQNNLLIPDLPEVTKEDNREGLWEANTEIGERPCIFGEKCMSWVMCEERIADDPETYARVTPFACKEFYFGEKAEQIRHAKANGIPLSEVYGPNQTMCLLCHLANVRNFYTDYDLEISQVRVHVLHAFQYQVGIAGQYPLEMMLMGDNTFKGVIAPFLRFCRDNYIWRPAHKDAAHARTPAASAKVLQHWDEAACLDF